MRRRVIVVLVLLLAGAVVNVAVAWGCAAWIPCLRPHEDYVYTTWYEGEHGFTATIYEDAGRTATGFFQTSMHRTDFDAAIKKVEPTLVTPVTEAELPSWSAAAQVRKTGRPLPEYRIGSNTYIVDFAFGWPWPALCYRIFILPSNELAVANGFFLASPTPSDVWAGHSAVPLRPTWPGIVVNTLFYAAALWLLIRGPFALRHLIRRRRGLCPACGYPIGESAVCSECGKALPGRKEAVT